MKINLLTFGDNLSDPVTGEQMTASERHRMIIEAAALADRTGWSGINVGEHHMGEFVLSSPPVLLSAIAERTENLRLGTAVCLGANLDPVRIAEDYATLDVVSGGRTELVVGRGNLFPHTYSLFGQDLDDSRELFAEGIEIVLALWTEAGVTWPAKFRAPLEGVTMQPPPLQKPHPPLWIGGGGSPETAELAAKLGLPLALPSAFSDPDRFIPVVEQYRERFASYGHTDRTPEVAACWHMNVGEDGAAAKRRWEPRYRAYSEWFASQVQAQNPTYKGHGFDFDWLLSSGPAMAGTPAEAGEKLQSFAERLGADTHLLYLDMGGMPAAELNEMIELIGSELIPNLRPIEVAA